MKIQYTPEDLADDIKRILQVYDAKSVGPEKLKVRATMETTIKQNKKLFQKTHTRSDKKCRRKKEATRRT